MFAGLGWPSAVPSPQATRLEAGQVDLLAEALSGSRSEWVVVVGRGGGGGGGADPVDVLPEMVQVVGAQHAVKCIDYGSLQPWSHTAHPPLS